MRRRAIEEGRVKGKVNKRDNVLASFFLMNIIIHTTTSMCTLGYKTAGVNSYNLKRTEL